jgi:Protein of unknown function (DUF3048) N-terminal domain/Protein of unknown function (DUF3048) C-terminal domain
MTLTSRTTRTVLVSALAVSLLATACGGGTKQPTPSVTPAAPAPSTPASSSPTPTPTPTPTPKPPAINPFTGLKGAPKYPTVAVKIDDTAPGRPQAGIDKADIVYIEEAEGGLTRLAAIFGGQHPSAVGYVRSTRPSDPDLLLQFGKITEAYSGGAHDSLPRVRASGITSWSNDAGRPYYSRASRVQSTYINLVLDVQKVAQHVKTPLPKDIGLRWSATVPAHGLPGKRFTTYVGGTLVEFRWYPKLKKYVRYIDGRPQHAADGKLVASSNVVVQKCRIVPHPQDTDVMGNPSMFTYTVGKGQAVVFRNGLKYFATWSRPKLGSGTTLRLASNNQPFALAPGGAWFALTHTKTRVNAS